MMSFTSTIKNAFAGLSIFISTFSFSQDPEVKTLPMGERVPMIQHQMENIDGKLFNLEALSGKNGLLIVFSCNTCPFVVGSESFEGWEKQYNELNKFAEANGFKMVLINSNEAKRKDDDSPEAMKKRALDKAYTMPYLMDKNSEVADAFGARTTPHVFLVNENMELIYTGAIDNKVDGKRTSDDNYLKNAIEAQVKGQEIKTNSTPPRGCSIKRVKK
ncbi:thioredoxin family protein [Fluviicola sp.]|uniref:thioredoxin family protein n=1 Tax=Fluviicola sp. TaxID=1917219 RepID=UPI0031DC21E6